jgi:hypothetical protein
MTFPIPSGFKQARRRQGSIEATRKRTRGLTNVLTKLIGSIWILAFKNKPDMYKVWRSKQNSRFCGTRVQVGLYSGTTLPDKRCPNCIRRETADHLLLCSNEDRTQLLIENTD